MNTRELQTWFWLANLQERDYYEGLRIKHGRRLKRVWRKWDGKAKTGFICFRIETSGELLVNDQLDGQFFSYMFILFQFSTCFEQPRAHHQDNQMYQYNIWYMSLCVGDRSVCWSEGSLPDIYQMLYWYNWFSWWWARGCSKHVENWNKHIEKNYASSWSFTKNHNKMHG